MAQQKSASKIVIAIFVVLIVVLALVAVVPVLIAMAMGPGVRTEGSSRQRCATRPIWPASRSLPAPMATRSLLRVVVATFHP